MASFFLPVGLYSESTGEMICLLQGQLGGVTHVLFSPDGTKLYSGGRKVRRAHFYSFSEISVVSSPLH